MPDQLQLRGGTTAEHSTFTGASKEITVDTTKKTLVVHDGSTAGGNPVMRENGSNSALALGSAGTPSLKFTGDTNTGIYSPGADQVAISTNGTGRLFIDASGNVGIGAPSSITGFELSSDIQIKYAGVNSEPSGSRYLIFNNTDTTLVNDQPLGGISWVNNDADATAGQAAFIKAYTATNAGSAYLTFGTGAQNAASEKLRITSDGKVGVGTTNASSLLSLGTSLANYKLKLYDGGDANDYGFGVQAGVLYYQSGGAHLFNVSGTERARIDSSGRLLVGTSSMNGSSDARLQIRGNITGAQYEGAISLATETTTNSVTASTTLGAIAFGNHNGTHRSAEIVAAGDAQWGTNDYPSRLVFSTTADGASSPTERMRIQSDGNILIGVTSGATGLLNVGPVANKTGIFGSASTAGSAGIQGAHTVNSATGYVAYFANSGSATGLYISNTAAWQSTSDERLKTDIQDLDAVSRLMQIKPRSYLWKSQATSDEPTKRNLGFIAQEVQEVFPELVGESPDGMLSVEYTGFIAPLVNTIQFLKAEIDALKAEVTALKAQ